MAQDYDHEEAEDMLFDAIMEHNNEITPKATVPAFFREIQWGSLDAAQRAMNLVMEFANDTPLWINKGRTPDELRKKQAPYIGKPAFVGAFADEMNDAWDQMIQGAPKRETPGVVMPFPRTDAQIRPFSAPSSPVKVGRNDPCPCGSGKKYKHCCGRNV